MHDDQARETPIRDVLAPLAEACRRAVAKSHGYVNPAPIKARCGGPGLCFHCYLESMARQVAKFAATRDDRAAAIDIGGGMKAKTDDYDSVLVLTDKDGVSIAVDVENLRYGLKELGLTGDNRRYGFAKSPNIAPPMGVVQGGIDDYGERPGNE